MKIHKVTQGSDDWHRLRAGIPTCSEFDNIVTPEFKAREGTTPDNYLFHKLAERLMGFPLQTGVSWAMNQGAILEGEAIPTFAISQDVKVDRVGFVTTDDSRVGCSPDGLIGEDGGLECKCPEPDTHLRYLVAGVLPKEYRAQVHGAMLVTGRAWWAFMSYSRQFPAFIIRVERDEEIQAKLRDALDPFLKKMDAMYAKVKALRDAENAVKDAAYQESISRRG